MISLSLGPEYNVIADDFKICPLQDVLSLLFGFALEQNDFTLETWKVLGLFLSVSFACLRIS